MKQFLLTTTFLLLTHIGFGQCPTDQIIFNTQAEIDNFAINYPNCTEILDGLLLDGNDITNLNGLNQIVIINGQFVVWVEALTNFEGLNQLAIINGEFSVSATSIESFEGLENLETIRDTFYVEFNPNLTSFDGLDSLTEIGSGLLAFKIEKNTALTNFQGLESLTKINGHASIRDNSGLVSFEGLNNLTSVMNMTISENSILNLSGLEGLTTVTGFLNIRDCALLQNLEGLESVNFIEGSLRITGNSMLSTIQNLENLDPNSFGPFGFQFENNPNLSICDIAYVCENLDAQNVIFLNNAIGCNSVAEVGVECEIVDIPDTNFLDALVNHSPVIDTNSDSNIQFDEAEAFTGMLQVSDNVISDFTGLEAFINITGFDGSRNVPTTLSLQMNTALTSVNFSDNTDLQTVNLNNGNNTSITSFNGVDCPTLEFVCVDDVAFAIANFTNIDPQVQFVDDCEVLSAPDLNLADSVVLFPNPVSETLTISITESFNLTRVEVYSVSGQKSKETSEKQIDMRDLSAGIYFVKVISEVGNVTKKIVKQ